MQIIEHSSLQLSATTCLACVEVHRLMQTADLAAQALKPSDLDAVNKKIMKPKPQTLELMIMHLQS